MARVLRSERRDPCNGVFFERGVGLLVDVGGLDAFVAKPWAIVAMSTPPARSSIALVCPSVCGVMRLPFRDGQLAVAVAVCFESRMVTP
jgi:hypothetical protein